MRPNSAWKFAVSTRTSATESMFGLKCVVQWEPVSRSTMPSTVKSARQVPAPLTLTLPMEFSLEASPAPVLTTPGIRFNMAMRSRPLMAIWESWLPSTSDDFSLDAVCTVVAVATTDTSSASEPNTRRILPRSRVSALARLMSCCV